MTRKLVAITALLLATNLSADTSDPCSGEADKISCIEDLIEQEKSRIEARITYLQTTSGPRGAQGAPGEKGPRGDQGPQGDQGSQGDQGPVGDTGPGGDKGPQGDQGLAGDDRRTEEEAHILARHQALKERYVDVLRTQLHTIDPAFYQSGGFYDSLPAVRRKLSDINRNPAIIKVPLDPDPISYSGLDWPRDENGDYLPSFSFTKGLESCTYTRNGSDFTESCVEGIGFTLVPVCDPNASPYSPSYCGQVIGDTQTGSIVLSEDNFEINLDVIVDLPEVETEFQIVSMNEWASYKLGMDPDDPIFRMAVDRIIGYMEDDDIRTAIEQILQEAFGGANAEYLVLIATNQAINPLYAAQLETERAKLEEATQVSLDLIESFSSPSYPQRHLRLAEHAMDSDMMYFFLVSTVIDIYMDYRACQYADLLPPSLPVTCELDWPLTTGQQAAFELMEEKLLWYAKDFMKKWQDTAYAMKTEYLANHPHSSLATLFGKDFPDFAGDARDYLAGIYSEGQSESVAKAGEYMVAAGVATSSIVATASFAFLGTASAFTFTTAANMGTLIAGSTAAFTEFVGLSTAGAIATAAGPIAIIGAAAALGILATTQVIAENKERKQYDALMAFDVNNNTLHAFDNDELTNLMYMWLMIDAPSGVENSTDW